MNRLYVLMTLSILVFSQCKSFKKSDSDLEMETISTGLKKASFQAPKKWMVILPGLGCNGCIQEGEAFMRDFIDSTGIFFILTKVQSVKILQQKIGKHINNRVNVFIDNDGVFSLPTKNVIYPCIVQLDNGKIVKHQFQSPANGQAFEWLKIQMEQ
ncbi:hypothetical protein HGH93_31110 [Chitinophaga polysaccharea]|uniref:hypothetical protein n=1 Tax=Chitinophaga TaxID=79328 RepID=UPI001455D15A|nr:MULTISPECIES: hypothetical protein [Chitinophaga]NLR62583.1 hypothetical protein [Chitinophaga polysaccharea]NLU91483.1 hypothetical protein [Chitinophaga sp. Ak27]